MSPFLENKSLIFRPLKQKDIFKMFEVKNNTVTWITWADVSPDYLYKNWIDV
jgi:catabolite regulation protein CreA